MKQRFFKHYMLFIVLTAFLLVMTGCGTKTENDPAPDNQQEKQSQNGESVNQANESSKKETALSSEDNPIVTITMGNGKEITIELYPEVAPNTVANFISLTKAQFYDGLIFHRVIPGFMIQGGDPTGTGTGGPGYLIKGEFNANGFENNLKHERGVISMARALDPNSAGSQFFIMAEEATHLDGEYAAFGKVLTGIEVVDEIINVKRDSDNKPLEEQKMKTVVVDTKGKDYPEPEVQ